MRRSVRFDAEKALEVLLYITQKTQNMYNALKVLYFADKQHLSLYGRQICGDSYVAMSNGAVPSGLYDIVKIARGDGLKDFDHLTNDKIKSAIKYISLNYLIKPLREPNMDFLSESDVECLKKALEEYGNLSFDDLKRFSHREKDYRSAIQARLQDDLIPLEYFVRSVGDGDLIWEEEFAC